MQLNFAKTMPKKMIYKLNEATIATRSDCAADRMLVTLVTAAGAYCITINGNLRFRLNHFHLDSFKFSVKCFRQI
jgi:hypothetical protein